MITHKKVIRAITNLHLMAVDDRTELVRGSIDDDLRIALNYVHEQRTQQEKVSKLLELYKELAKCFYYTDHDSLVKADNISRYILKIEEELK